MKTSCLLLTMVIYCANPAAHASVLERDEVRNFIDAMSSRHGFSAAELNAVFERVVFSDAVIEAISRPAEVLPWHQYRTIFLGRDRISQGVAFWRKHAAALRRAEEQFGVPAELLVAIIGVETRFGKIRGKYTVIDALSTLAFDYPKRSAFFLSELEHYLLLTREQGFDPLMLKGSYAGAMGIPQFVPSSYRHFAIDFDGDGSIDIWDNPVDAIGCVGNYIRRHGWRTGAAVVVPARVEGDNYKNLVTGELKPSHTAEEMQRHDVTTASDLPEGTLVKLLVLDNGDQYEYWLGLENFYVITRYNHSAHYAMAVFQLAEAIRSGYRK
jgi:membrane-bound lytic murein transglycosylase B